RYLLPAYPPAIVLAARLISLRWLALLPVMAAEVMLAAPRFHSYTNVAAPSQLVPDQDYGQSLLALRDWMSDNNVAEMTVVSIGWVDPAIYDIQWRAVDAPPTPFVAIGKTYLTGIPAPSHGRFVLVRRWRELRHAEPVADLGGMLVFAAAD